MPAEQTKQPSNPENKLDVIATQVTYMVKSIDELKEQMSGFESKRSTEWLEYKVEHARIVSNVSDNSDDIQVIKKDINAMGENTKIRYDTLAKNMADLEKAIQPLIMSNKILVWIGGILGGSAILLIWGILTHTITIAVP